MYIVVHPLVKPEQKVTDIPVRIFLPRARQLKGYVPEMPPSRIPRPVLPHRHTSGWPDVRNCYVEPFLCALCVACRKKEWNYNVSVRYKIRLCYKFQRRDTLIIVLFLETAKKHI